MPSAGPSVRSLLDVLMGALYPLLKGFLLLRTLTVARTPQFLHILQIPILDTMNVIEQETGEDIPDTVLVFKCSIIHLILNELREQKYKISRPPHTLLQSTYFH